jgi:hypothetical protein
LIRCLDVNNTPAVARFEPHLPIQEDNDSHKHLNVIDATPGPATQSPWARWAVPSVVDQIFVALLYVLVCTPHTVRLLSDAGTGWHIRNGQHILLTHTIPRTDYFSSTMTGRPWFAWEWLYDVIAGELDRVAGLNGVTWLTAVIILVVFCWVFHELIARGTHVVVAPILTLLAAVASMIHYLARPHVLSWLFTLTFFCILDSTERGAPSAGHSRRLWLLPIVMLVWANVHGGFLLGLVLIGIYWLASILPPLEGEVVAAGPTRRRARDLTWVGAACALASLVNPYGWKLYVHIYSYLSNQFIMAHNLETQSPDFHGLAQQCFLLLLLTSVVVFVVRARKLRMSQLLVALFAIYSALCAVRNLPTSSILLVLTTGPLVPSSSARGFVRQMVATELNQRGHLWPIAAIIVTGCIAANGGRIGSTQIMNAHFGPHRMPVAAVNYLEGGPIPSPILSPDYWGGYLIYRLFPRSKVVLDDRHDLYGEDFMRSYLRMLNGDRGWEEFLHQHSAACLLLPPDSALTSLLLKTAGWTSIYQDDVAIIFVPARSQTTANALPL